MKKSVMTYVLMLACAVSICGFCSCDKDDTIDIIENGGKGDHGKDPEVVEPVKVDTINIVNYTFHRQNLLTNEKASLVVNLTHPAYFVVVKETSGRYDISDVTYSSDRKQLTIGMPFFTYGTDYHLVLTLCDSLMQHRFVHQIDINGFNEVYQYEGDPESAICDYDRETIWMATTFPDRLYRISLSDPGNPQYIDFPNCPNVLTVNPYNGKLYVGFTINDYDQLQQYSKMMYVCDAETLAKEDSFQISWKDNTGYIDASPRSIAFTDDGWGVAVRSHYGDSGTDLCYVDSKNGHQTRVDNCWDKFYGYATTNYDQKSVILQKLGYSSHDLEFVNRGNNATIRSFAVVGNFHSDEYYAGGNRMASRFHRSKPQFLVQCVRSLCLIDYSKDTYSPVYIQEGREPCIEFDYNHDNHVIKFDCMGNYVINIDMESLKEQYVGCLTSVGIKEIFHNPKRDQLIVVQYAGGYSSASRLTLIDMDSFR